MATSGSKAGGGGRRTPGAGGSRGPGRATDGAADVIASGPGRDEPASGSAPELASGRAARVDRWHAHARRNARAGAGERVHVALAAGALVCIGGPTSVVEIGTLALAGFGLLRGWETWRLWVLSLQQPAAAAWVAFGLFCLLSLAWSPDLRLGLDQTASLRWLWLVMLLFPVLHRRRLLVCALAAGLALGIGSQAVQIALERATGADPFGRLPGRDSGWWDPVVGGTMLVGLLGLTIGAAGGERGWRRVAWAGLGAVTLAAIAATGTRGAYIGAAGLLGVAGLAGAWSFGRAWLAGPRGGERGVWRRLGAGSVVAVVVLVAGTAAVGAVVWPGVRDRVERGAAEVRAAAAGEYASDTGSRVRMWMDAGDAFAAEPVAGVGAGGFRAWVIQQREAILTDAERAALPVPHAHAHGVVPHIAATGGVIGLGLFGLAAGLTVWSAWCPSRREGRGRVWGIEAAPGWGALGVLAAGLFDTVHVNAQTAALLLAFVALAPSVAPRAKTRTGGGRVSVSGVGSGVGSIGDGGGTGTGALR